MKIEGWFYLHTNNELIYKPDPGAIADIRESDFAIMAWAMNSKDRGNAWGILVEALSLGAKKDRVLELAHKWGCNDKDADVYAEKIGVKFIQEGNSLCAVTDSFINLQESPCGFGATKLEALGALCRALEYKSCKLGWGASFADLVKKNNAVPA